MIKAIISNIARYHFIVAIAATLFAAETYILVQQQANITILLLVFASTLAAYSLADLELCFFSGEKNKINISVSGTKPSVVFTSASAVTVLLCLHYLESRYLLLLCLVVSVAVLYINPVRIQTRRLLGIRHIFIFKNITLALVWAIATVWVPLMAVKLNLFLQEHNIIFLRRFLFVFGLALIFDVRDIEKDKMAAMRTVATEYGVLATKAFAITALALFFLLTFLTPIASASIALSISAIMAMLVVWQVKTSSSALYYLVAVDGLMIAQFLLILVWPIV